MTVETAATGEKETNDSVHFFPFRIVGLLASKCSGLRWCCRCFLAAIVEQLQHRTRRCHVFFVVKLRSRVKILSWQGPLEQKASLQIWLGILAVQEPKICLKGYLSFATEGMPLLRKTGGVQQKVLGLGFVPLTFWAAALWKSFILQGVGAAPAKPGLRVACGGSLAEALGRGWGSQVLVASVRV